MIFYIITMPIFYPQHYFINKLPRHSIYRDKSLFTLLSKLFSWLAILPWVFVSFLKLSTALWVSVFAILVIDVICYHIMPIFGGKYLHILLSLLPFTLFLLHSILFQNQMSNWQRLTPSMCVAIYLREQFNLHTWVVLTTLWKRVLY